MCSICSVTAPLIRINSFDTNISLLRGTGVVVVGEEQSHKLPTPGGGSPERC